MPGLETSGATDTLPPRSPLGSRGRIGLIQPAAAVVIEHEWPRLLPPNVLFPNARVGLNGPTPADYAAMAQLAPDAGQLLVAAGADVICYACTIGSIFAGAAWERRLVARLAESCATPAVSIGAASIAALKALQAKSVAILSPYSDAINALVADYVEECGLEVAGIGGLGVGIAEAATMSAAEVARIAIVSLAAHERADALWIPCTAIRTLEAIPMIEAACGRPIVSGSQGLLWAALRTIGIDDVLPGGGELLTLTASPISKADTDPI